MREHGPRLVPQQRYCCKPSRAKCTLSTLVGLRQRVPNMQKSTSHTTQQRLRRMRSSGGVSQMRDVFGFSNVKGIRYCTARSSTRHEKRSRTLPTVTRAVSPGRKAVCPIGIESVRKGGGLPGLSLAREKLLQGVPKCPARIRPCWIQCTIRC